MRLSDVKWRASEFQHIEPFLRSDGILNNCTLRISRSEEHSVMPTRNIDSVESWIDFAPEIRIVVDKTKLVEEIGITSNELSVAIVLRDYLLNRFVKIQEWELDNLPDSPISLTSGWLKISKSPSIDITIIVTPTQSKERQYGIATRHGDVVASRTFKIRDYRQRPSFPKMWVKPSDFVQRGCSSDTVWLLNWLAEDYERPIQECLQLWVNEKYRDNFDVLNSENLYTNPFKSEMASAVLSEIVQRVFRSSDPPLEEFGLKAQILEVLADASQLKSEEVLAMVERPDFIGLSHAWIQQYTGLNSAMIQL